MGRYERQLCIAAWNAGALTLTPSTFRDGPEPERWLCWIRMPPLPLLPGSGKFWTPCARMHRANAMPLPALPALPVPGPDEPHAASARPATATAAVVDLIERMDGGVRKHR